ncbi:hypothetical protein [Streptomyces sp. NPDC002346]
MGLPLLRRTQLHPRPTLDRGIVSGGELAWGLKASKLDEKYKIERLTHEEKAENLQAINGDVAEDEDALKSDKPDAGGSRGRTGVAAECQ